MSGPMTSYKRYLQSLEDTPEPVEPPKDRSINLHKLYAYLQDTGKNTSDLSKDEFESFIFLLNKENA